LLTSLHFYSCAVNITTDVLYIGVQLLRLDKRVLAAIVFVLLLTVIAVAGCRGSTSTANSSNGKRDSGGDENSDFIEGDEGKTADEKDAAEEALNYVQDANPGSEFKVVDIAVDDGWARLVVEEMEVPTEEAIGFSVYLRKIPDGKWEVAQTGNGVSPEDFPDAPEGIFEP